VKPKRKSQNKTLCVVAGASGGHITPAIVLAKQWLEQNPDGSILFFGTTSACPLVSSALRSPWRSRAYRETSHIPCNLAQRPGKKIWRYPFFFSQLLFTFFKSLYHLKKQNPEKIITTGGLLAMPVAIAGWLLRIPIELYELNVIPGKAIHTLAPLASKIFLTFEQSKKHFQKHSQKCEVIDYPLRFTQADKIFDHEKIIEKTNRNKTIKFSQTNKTIFFMGGSQGSIFINNLAKRWANEKERQKNIQVIHQTGSRDKTDWKNFYEQRNIPAHVFAYEDQIQNFYLISDLIVCRAGAGTLFELAFFQKKSVVIPLRAKTTDHQVENAREMAKRYSDLFTVREQEDLLSTLTQLLN